MCTNTLLRIMSRVCCNVELMSWMSIWRVKLRGWILGSASLAVGPGDRGSHERRDSTRLISVRGIAGKHESYRTRTGTMWR